jgi:hypothetical protein
MLITPGIPTTTGSSLRAPTSEAISLWWPITHHASTPRIPTRIPTTTGSSLRAPASEAISLWHKFHIFPSSNMSVSNNLEVHLTNSYYHIAPTFLKPVYLLRLSSVNFLQPLSNSKCIFTHNRRPLITILLNF